VIKFIATPIINGLDILAKHRQLDLEERYRRKEMKLDNKFIIIVPVYNAKDLIVECLSSIISQDFDDLCDNQG
jgi:hypothetical protein